MKNRIKCPRCGNDEVWKAGKPRGKQQCKCKACQKVHNGAKLHQGF